MKLAVSAMVLSVLNTLFAVLILASPASAQETLNPSLARTEPGSSLLWFDIRHLGVEGKGWTDTKAPYDRLPAKAQGIVRAPVWKLSRDSAGMLVHFVTDATEIHARWALLSNRLAMPHMPATGVSGLDLYVKSDDGSWRWLAVGQPTETLNTRKLVGAIPPKRRHYMLYFPLYNGVSSVEIGLPEGSLLATLPRDARTRKPIVFWGTSITHGACASRPGMVHTAILGRKLERPVVNLGFSGNGRMEPEMAELIAELEAAVFVIDCLPNLSGQEVTERVEPLVKTLRDRHPQPPIFLVEDRTYADAFLVSAKRQRNGRSRAALQAAFERLVSAGIPQLYYLPGENLLGNDGEGTVDSSHPNDLGFWRQAQEFEKVLVPLLQ